MSLAPCWGPIDDNLRGGVLWCLSARDVRWVLRGLGVPFWGEGWRNGRWLCFAKKAFLILVGGLDFRGARGQLWKRVGGVGFGLFLGCFFHFFAIFSFGVGSRLVLFSLLFAWSVCL